ncbi:MAG: zinc metallopeptidase [Planctomycetota bacterium]|jgi:Zn-dependent membrane protease YugP
MGYYQMFDPVYWIIVGPTMLLALYAQMKVKGAYARWKQVRNGRNMTGAQAAAEMLEREGVTDCGIELSNGFLSDHYDPSSKTLRLSPDVYNGRSVASVGIACHEAGHAMQHAESYGPLALRSFLVPLASTGSWLSMVCIMLGFFMMTAEGGFGLSLAKFGVVCFGAIVAFQLVTLPVEFNASSRAKAALQRNGVLTSHEEIDGVNAVLNAAALTYVAAAISALAQLLYWALKLGLLGGRSDD